MFPVTLFSVICLRLQTLSRSLVEHGGRCCRHGRECWSFAFGCFWIRHIILRQNPEFQIELSFLFLSLAPVFVFIRPLILRIYSLSCQSFPSSRLIFSSAFLLSFFVLFIFYILLLYRFSYVYTFSSIHHRFLSSFLICFFSFRLSIYLFSPCSPVSYSFGFLSSRAPYIFNAGLYRNI